MKANRSGSSSRGIAAWFQTVCDALPGTLNRAETRAKLTVKRFGVITHHISHYFVGPSGPNVPTITWAPGLTRATAERNIRCLIRKKMEYGTIMQRSFIRPRSMSMSPQPTQIGGRTWRLVWSIAPGHRGR